MSDIYGLWSLYSDPLEWKLFISLITYNLRKILCYENSWFVG